MVPTAPAAPVEGEREIAKQEQPAAQAVETQQAPATATNAETAKTGE